MWVAGRAGVRVASFLPREERTLDESSGKIARYSDPDVQFAHKGGFMCKTTALEPERLQELIRGAVIPQTS